MECEKCKSEDLECTKQEVKFSNNYYYDEPDEYWVIHLKCNNCSYEFTECI